MLWTLLIWISLALGQESSETATETETASPEMRLVLRVVAENWADEAVGSLYRTGALASGAALVLPVWNRFMVDIEFTYKRMPMGARAGGESIDGTISSDYTFEFLPLSVLAEMRLGEENALMHTFIGLGPALATFSERHAPNDEGLSMTTGGKICVETRAGVRVDTGLVQPGLSGISAGGLAAIELEVFVGRRFQRPAPAGSGFNLSGWRGGLGLALLF